MMLMINGKNATEKLYDGGTLYNDTSAHTGTWFAIQVIADMALTSLTGNLAGTLTSITYPAGLVIYGGFTAIQLASGTVICYNG